jgi:hypothetical protein
LNFLFFQASETVEELRKEYVDVLFNHALTPLADSATSMWVRRGLVFTTSWDAFRRDARVEPSVTYVGLAQGSWVNSATLMLRWNSEVRAAIEAYVHR